jgi:hypothetical protein
MLATAMISIRTPYSREQRRTVACRPRGCGVQLVDLYRFYAALRALTTRPGDRTLET